MPTTLITGANAFVAGHIIQQLIEAGHDVVGTVRKEVNGEQILDAHPEWREKFTPVVVQDITDRPSWDAIFQSRPCDHVIHVAAPLLDNPANTDYDRDFLRPSVEGNLALLRSAQAFAPSLKSIAVTGSINASTTGSPEELKQGPLNSDTWLPISQEEARKQNDAYISYCSAKKEGELALWDYVKTERPHFTVTVFLPALNEYFFGPPIEPIVGGVKGLHYSTRIIYSLFNSESATVPATTFPSYIDVRDLATAHVRALTEHKVANKRLNVGGLPLTYTAMAHALAKVPELKGRVAADSGEDKNVTPVHIEAQEANEALGLKLRTLEQTMADAARRILELEKLS